MKYFWPIIIVITVLAVWVVNSTRSDVRLFCSYGRVFIEFQDGNNVWGALMLDDDGIPMRCNSVELKTRARNIKEMI